MLETEDGVRDKDEDAVDVTERGVGLLEGEETDWMTGAGSGGGGADGNRRGVNAIKVVIVSVMAIKLPILVGETLGCRGDELKEVSCETTKLTQELAVKLEQGETFVSGTQWQTEK